MAGRIVAHVTTMYARARRKPLCGSLRLKDSSMRNLQRLLLWTLAILVLAAPAYAAAVINIVSPGKGIPLDSTATKRKTAR